MSLHTSLPTSADLVTISASVDPVERVPVDGGFELRTSRSATELSRRWVVFGGWVVATAAGLAGLAVPWLWLAVLPGLALARFGGLLVRPRRVATVRVGSDGWELRTDDAVVVAPPPVRIEGRYETQGWDGRSVISAVDADGRVTTILTLTGTDPAHASAVCRLLADAARSGWRYEGPFGEVRGDDGASRRVGK